MGATIRSDWIFVLLSDLVVTVDITLVVVVLVVEFTGDAVGNGVP